MFARCDAPRPIGSWLVIQRVADALRKLGWPGVRQSSYDARSISGYFPTTIAFPNGLGGWQLINTTDGGFQDQP